jgi:serine/threonine-protein kinase HipA
MAPRELAVSINEEQVGYLRESENLWHFEYAAEWARAAEGFDLAPALPRSQLLHSDGATLRPVQWYFDNLLPEESLRVILAKEARIPADDAFGLLAYFGAESAGSLVLREPGKPAPVERGTKPLLLVELSRRIANLPKASLSQGAPKKMSLAGAQHKLPVVFDHGQLFEPLPATPSTHILKPNHVLADHYPSSVMNEYFIMRLAKEVGLDVPEVHRMYVPQPVYIVERFDRIRGASLDDVQRLHVIDTCQLLNKSPAFKYTGANLDTLVRAAELCRERALARQYLYRWLVFNVLVGNSDNHLKNISFRVDASGIHLAPAYDLLSTAVYETRAMANENSTWPETSMTIPLGEATTFANVTRAHAIGAGRALGLAEATAARLLADLARAVPRAAERLIAEIQAGLNEAVSGSPDVDAAKAHAEGEMRMLRAIHKLVLSEMSRRLLSD